LPGLSKEKVIDLKLEGSKESELYRMLLLAQCHALHSAMPFLFEGIDDETELVLPENLLHSDSIIRKLVAASDPKDWQEVEVLGWLYQFYISERKAEVMARDGAVPSEDIPARTQLFTPHWIVRYLVENSLGRLWLLNHPGSRLREHMPYYIEGEAETDFLKITKPEEIRLLDPACGSGHMLTYAFDLLFLIYEEEGYVPNEIPALILRHNLYGLEICPRAAQIANLALVFKAREKSPRFIQSSNLVQPHILALQNVHFDDRELSDYIAALDLGGLFNQPMLDLLHQFEEATTFGSLIQPCLNETGIAYARGAIEAKHLGGQLFLRETHIKVLRVLEQAEMLCQRYHLVVANPPYMGRDVFNTSLKAFVKAYVPEGAIDLYGCFIVRNLKFLLKLGYCGMITIPNWMFLPSFGDLREALYQTASINTLLHNGRGVWGSDFGSCSFVIQKGIVGRVGRYKRLFVLQGEVNPNEVLIERFHDNKAFPYQLASSAEFEHIPNKPVAYWLSPKFRRAFGNSKLIRHAESGGRCKTSNDQDYLRFIWEVDAMRVGVTGSWCPMFKGGEYRKYFGNLYHVMKWTPHAKEYYRTVGGLTQERFWNRTGITWTIVSANAHASFRHKVAGAQYNSVSPTLFFYDANEETFFLGLLNSKPVNALLQILNPTIALNVGDLLNLPVPPVDFRDAGLRERNEALFSLAQSNWNNSETSWNFRDQPLLRPALKGATLEASWEHWKAHCAAAIRRMQELETENNRLFIEAYGLADELTPEVPEEQITLARADARRDMAALLSYAVGCMMGRYSLDKPGLILANAGDSLAEYLAKVGKPLDTLTFAPDEDAIIPVLDGEWFENDIVTRTRDFLRATFGKAMLETNLLFIEESVGKDLRKDFLTDFYTDHLQTYKKSPIYWLFSSGKERAFQALVYLHRYHEGTLSRMRTEYVIPLQGKITSRIDQLADDIQKATSTSHLKKMQKERDRLLKQRTELQAFDEKLRHYADQRIQLDLDDGVKVNYGKFGDLLAEVKAVTGGSED
jgi:hypothetical protein